MTVLERIFSKTADAVFAINSLRQVVYVNTPLVRLCGRSRNGLVGQYCYNAFKTTTLSGDAFCSPDCPIGRSLELNGSVPNVDLVLPKKDGFDEWINVGVLVAPPEWQPANIIFTVRPFSIPKIVGRFVKDKQKTASQRVSGLTHRETQVLRKLAQGDRISLIAQDLHISNTTVRNHISNIYQKLELHSRAEIVSYAYKNDLI